MSSHREQMVGNNPARTVQNPNRWLLIFMIVTAVLTHETSNRKARFCHYEANGIQYTLTIQKIYSCPFTIEVEQ